MPQESAPCLPPCQCRKQSGPLPKERRPSEEALPLPLRNVFAAGGEKQAPKTAGTEQVLHGSFRAFRHLPSSLADDNGENTCTARCPYALKRKAVPGNT